MNRFAAPLLAALAAVPAVAADVAPARGEDATVALNFQDVELPVLARFVSEVTGRNLIVDDRVRGKVTIVSPTRITPDEAWAVFQSVLQVKGFAAVPSGSFVKIVPVRDARESALPPTAADADALVTRILDVRHADAQSLVPVLQPLVSKDGVLTAFPATNRLLVVDGAANVERLAALLTQLDGPGGGQTVETVRLRFAPAGELAPRLRDALAADGGAGALRVVAETRSNALVLSGPATDVARARELAARLDVALPPGASQLHVQRLHYAQATELVRVLAQLLGLPPPPPEPVKPRGSALQRAQGRLLNGQGFDGGMGEPAAAPAEPPPAPLPVATGGGAVPLEAPVRLTADPATNTLVVSCTPADWETLRRVIEDLDVRRRQVFVEAIVLEATVDRMRELGIELQGAGTAGSEIGFGQVNLSALGPAVSNPTSVPGLILAAASSRMITLPNGQQVPAHTALLTALQTDTELNVLSAPNVVTTDNEEAEIVVGKNVPFLASRATSSSNLDNLFATVERHDVGITLRMTPQITAEDFVHMTLFEEVSDIDRTPDPAVGDPNLVGPTTTVRSASTVVGARNGQTVVIGGLLADSVRHEQRSVPFLGDVPVLGWLFRRDIDRRVKTNLLVFLTPHVIGGDDDARDVAVRQRDGLPRGVRTSPVLEGPSWTPPGHDAAGAPPE